MGEGEWATLHNGYRARSACGMKSQLGCGKRGLWFQSPKTIITAPEQHGRHGWSKRGFKCGSGGKPHVYGVVAPGSALSSFVIHLPRREDSEKDPAEVCALRTR